MKEQLCAVEMRAVDLHELGVWMQAVVHGYARAYHQDRQRGIECEKGVAAACLLAGYAQERR